jgi:hypothetical protein
VLSRLRFAGDIISHPAAVRGHTGKPSPKIEDAHGGYWIGSPTDHSLTVA